MKKELTAVEWLETKVNGMIENGGDADLLAVIEHIQQAKSMEEEQQGYSKEDMKKAIVRSALSNIDNMIERCDEIIEEFKKK